MKRLVRIAVLMSVAWAMAALVPGPALAEETKAVVEADHAFVQALG